MTQLDQLATGTVTDGIGQFEQDGREFVVTTTTPPLPYDNYLFNRRYLSVTDHLGRGWSKLHTSEGHVTFLWHLSAMYERDLSRIVFLRDAETGAFWSISGMPGDGVDEYRCRHGQGYSEIESSVDGLSGSWRLMVPEGFDPVELWRLSIHNISERPRVVDVFSYGAISLRGALTHGYIHFCRGRWDQGLEGLYFENNAPALPHPRYKAFAAWDRAVDSYDASRNAFRGLYESLNSPVAVSAGQCSGSEASREPMAACLHARVSLAPGQTETWHQLSGITASLAEAAELKARYLGEDQPTVHAHAIEKEATKRVESVWIKTPDADIDRLINFWAKQQVALGAGWGRWGWRGYRDLVQQTHGALYFDPRLSRANISESLTWQMRNGFAVRGWAPFSPKRYADSALWLCYTVNDYVKEIGDTAYVHRELPYRDGDSGPVWQHLLRGCERAFSDVGPHGLPLIHQGDWNDSLSAVGAEGRGESVWLAEALCWSLRHLEELFEAAGLSDQKQEAFQWRQAMADRINEHAWDGQWYIRGFRDDGRPIGSSENDEGSIYLNAQTWAILGGVATEQRQAAMLESVDRHLRIDYGLLSLAPAYTTFDPSIGRITGMPAGTGENAAVYVHANAFFYAAMLEINEPDRALEVISAVQPCNRVNPPARSGAAPYVLPNSYYGPGYGPRPGRIEGTWVTGSASWFLHQTIERLCGVQRSHQGLTFDPRLPSSWDEINLKRSFRGDRFNVAVRRVPGVTDPRVTFDGKVIQGSVIEPPGDGSDHFVEVEVGDANTQ